MVTAFLFAAVCLQGQAGAAQSNTQQDDGVAIISKMLARYAASKTMTGSVHYTITASGQSATVDTVLQYEKPSKLYLRQVNGLGSNDVALITSDGKQFTYDTPRDNLHQVQVARSRLLEWTHQKRSDGVIVEFVVGDIYKAASQSLIDRSEALDIVIGRYDDLVYRRGQWKTVHLNGKVKLGAKEANQIVGEWRPYGTADVVGTYEMFITDDGDLVRFVRHETAQPEGLNQPVQVTSVWDVNLVVNGTPDPSLFKIVK